MPTINPDWLAGFISGEGCFYISITKDSTKRTGFSVSLWFILGQHSRDRELIEKLHGVLACGNIRLEKSMVLLRVSKFSDITDKIIPFLDKQTVQGIKYFDYLDFKRAALLIKSKAHLTPFPRMGDGLAQIRTIKEGMNVGRDYLKFSSEGELGPSIGERNQCEQEPSSLVPNLRVNTLGGMTQKRSYSVWCSNKLKSFQRIGPHDLDVLSLIVGSLLSNSYLEKREHGLGIRIIFIKCSNNVEYLMWFHSFLAKKGYCSSKKPKLSKLIGVGNKVLFVYSFKSYSFSSFNWLFDMFYRDNIKIIPRNLDKYLTPLALATLFLSSNGLGKKVKLGKKAKLATTLVKEDLKYLSVILKNNYNIETIIKFDNNSGLNDRKYSGGSLYIKNTSVSTFSKIVKPHILHSQHYLLNTPILKLNFYGTHGLHNSSISYLPKRGFSTKKIFPM